MDKGLIMRRTGEQEHLIAADFFNLRIAQPLSIDRETCGQFIDMEKASIKILIIEVKIEYFLD